MFMNTKESWKCEMTDADEVSLRRTHSGVEAGHQPATSLAEEKLATLWTGPYPEAGGQECLEFVHQAVFPQPPLQDDKALLPENLERRIHTAQPRGTLHLLAQQGAVLQGVFPMPCDGTSTPLAVWCGSVSLSSKVEAF